MSSGFTSQCRPSGSHPIDLRPQSQSNRPPSSKAWQRLASLCPIIPNGSERVGVDDCPVGPADIKEARSPD